MNLINKNKGVIALLIPILILILFRIFSPGHFKINAKKWAEPSFNGSNMVKSEMLGTLKGEKLLINLGEEKMIPGVVDKSVRIKPDSLLNKLYMIKEHKGPVILFSSDTSVSARIWMVLSQMGFKNIFILTGDEITEFQPDTIRPEL